MTKLKIFSILEKSLQGRGESPTFCLQNEQAPDNYILASDALRCLQRHGEFLHTRLLKDTGVQDHNGNVVVAFLSYNSVDVILSIIAATRDENFPSEVQDHVVALLNVRWTESEMASALQSQNPQDLTLLLYGPEFETIAPRLCNMLKHKAICLPIPKFSDDFFKPIEAHPAMFTTTNDETDISKIEKDVDDGDAIIVFTSGTTGGAKGVRLSHRALAVQSYAKMNKPCYYASSTTLLASTTPFFHIGGLSSALAVLLAGGSLVFPAASTKGFDPVATRECLQRLMFPINTLVVVPAMLVSLLEQDDGSWVYPKVQLILIGGQSANLKLLSKLRQAFPNARIVQTYACSEAASSLTFREIASTKKALRQDSSFIVKGDCVGYPPMHVDLRLYRREGKATKIVSTPHRIGAIATRGAHLMNGYWQRGSKSHATLSGWHITGDLGFWGDDGQLYFCGRSKDIVRSGGETVICQEVEKVLLQHPHVKEVAVFPRSDERLGEAVSCALVTTKSMDLGPLREWCKVRGLAGYKRPRYIFLVDSLPRNSSGKVVKHELIRRFGRQTAKL